MPRREKWEYCRLFVDRPGAEVYVEYFRAPTHELQRLGQAGQTREEQKDAWSRSIAELGLAGWELAGVTAAADAPAPDGVGLYFKRRR